MGPVFYFFQNFFIQVYGLCLEVRFITFLPSVVQSSAQLSCVTVTLHVMDK